MSWDKGRQNNYNLSCDLMEPFRPFVDEIVYNNIERSLDRDYKNELISVTKNICCYGKRKMKIEDAMEAFTLDILRGMNATSRRKEDIHFV